jgi:hypothetical protein
MKLYSICLDQMKKDEQVHFFPMLLPIVSKI